MAHPVEPFMEKVNMKKDIYIEAIEYGKKRLGGKRMTTKIDLKAHLESKGFIIPDSNFLSSIFLDIFGTQFMRNKSLSNDPSYLNSDAYFKLLDYEELKHARESSEQAKRMAIIAITISGLLALFSILLTVYQMN